MVLLTLMGYLLNTTSGEILLIHVMFSCAKQTTKSEKLSVECILIGVGTRANDTVIVFFANTPNC